MPPFDPRDPFPLRAFGSLSYAEEQAHAFAADAWLGLDLALVERELMARGCRRRAPGASGEAQELWFGLAASSLLTPYVEIRRLLAAVGAGPGCRIADLGAAYGRMGFVTARCYPGASFVGYEYAGERVREGGRALARFALGLGADARLVHADLSAATFAPAAADVYFIYDYGTPKAIEKTLHDLRRLAQSSSFVLVARGTRCREAIERRHGWLRLDPETRLSDRALLFRAENVEARPRAAALQAAPA